MSGLHFLSLTESRDGRSARRRPAKTILQLIFTELYSYKLLTCIILWMNCCIFFWKEQKRHEWPAYFGAWRKECGDLLWVNTYYMEWTLEWRIVDLTEMHMLGSIINYTEMVLCQRSWFEERHNKGKYKLSTSITLYQKLVYFSNQYFAQAS